MRLVQVITDYIRRSILTTQGDLIVRGVGQPESLSAGEAGTVLTSQGIGAIPAYEEVRQLYYEPPEGATYVDAFNEVINNTVVVYSVEAGTKFFLTSMDFTIYGDAVGRGWLYIRNSVPAVVATIIEVGVLSTTGNFYSAQYPIAKQILAGYDIAIQSNGALIEVSAHVVGYTRPV